MIIFTNHSSLKLKQRGISKAVTIKTLKFPDYKFSSYNKRMVAYKKFDKIYLKVIYKIEERNIIVITKYWEGKPKFIK